MATMHPTNLPTHRDEVARYLETCSDVFGQLAALARAIETQSENHSDLKKLAGVAYYLAYDYENMADCWREEIKENGVRNT